MFEFIKNLFCKHSTQNFMGNKNIIKHAFIGSAGGSYAEGRADIFQCADCGKQIEKNFVAKKTTFLVNTENGVKKTVLEKRK